MHEAVWVFLIPFGDRMGSRDPWFKDRCRWVGVTDPFTDQPMKRSMYSNSRPNTP